MKTILWHLLLLALLLSPEVIAAGQTSTTNPPGQAAAADPPPPSASEDEALLDEPLSPPLDRYGPGGRHPMESCPDGTCDTPSDLLLPSGPLGLALIVAALFGIYFFSRRLGKNKKRG